MVDRSDRIWSTGEGNANHFSILALRTPWTEWKGKWSVSSHKCLFFSDLYFYFILIYNPVLVLPYIDMNPLWVYMRSQTWTPLPTPSLQHPSGSSPCTSPKHAVSCIRHRRVIWFLHDTIHVSMPFSQIIPPSPSPSESKRLFYTSVSLLLLAYRVIITIFLNSIYMH